MEPETLTPEQMNKKVLAACQQVIDGNLKTAETLKNHDGRFVVIEKTLADLKGELSTKAGQEKIVQAAHDAQAAIKFDANATGITVGDCKGLLEAEKKAGRPFSIALACKAIANKGGVDFRGAELEREVFEETRRIATQKRAMGYLVDTDGGYLVPPQVESQVIERLTAQSVVRQAGPLLMSGLRGAPVQLPRLTGGATHYWVGEAETITDSKLAVGMVSLTPKKSAVLVIFSNELAQMAGPAAEALIQEDMALQLALGEDLAYLRGTGSSKQPLGMVNYPNINTKSLNATLEIAHFVNMIYELMVDNVLFRRPRWFMHSRTWKDAFNIQDTQGRPLIIPDPTSKLPTSGSIYGIPFSISNQLPINLGGTTDESELILAEMGDVVVGDWGGMEIMPSDHYKFAEDQRAIRVTRRTDLVLRHEESICLTNDVRTA